MVPKKLQSLFDSRGYAMLREFSDATGITYPNVLRRVQAGEIPAVDVSPPGSSRCQWRIYEEQVAEWFAARLSRRPAELVAQSVPDFYSESGEWIPPEHRSGRNKPKSAAENKKTADGGQDRSGMDDPAQLHGGTSHDTRYR